MRIIFLGTPKFAVPSLEALVKDKHEILLAISQPDRETDRKGNLLPTPVKECTTKLNLPFLSCDNVNQITEELKALKPDVLITVAFGQMLGDDFLSIAPTLNVHASLLPLYRGASPIQASILVGDKKTGITIMQTVKKMDAGDILLQRDIDIKTTDTYETLHDKLSVLGARTLTEVLKQLKEGNIKQIPQDEIKATYTKKIIKTSGSIDWSKSAEDIERQIRAYNPWPSAYSTYAQTGEIIKFYSAIAHKTHTLSDIFQGLLDITASNGTILHSSPQNGLFIKCGLGILQITSLQAPSKKILPSSEFLLGRNLIGKFE